MPGVRDFPGAMTGVRFAHFAANIRFNFYGQMFQAVVPFFFIPFLLRHLGVEAYALYALIAILAGQMNLLSFGAGPATIKYLAGFDAAKDITGAQRLVGTSLAFYGGTGLLGAGILAVAALLFRGGFFHVSADLVPAARFVFLCAAAVFFLQSLARTFQAVPQAMQRFDCWNGVETAAALLLYGGAYILLRQGYWLRALAVWNVVVCAATLGGYAILAGRLRPELRWRPLYDSRMMRRIASMGGFLFLGQVAWSVFFQGDKIVLGRFLPLGEVAYYLIAFSLAQKLLFLLGPVLPALMPFSSALHGRGEFDSARRLYLSGTKITLILTLPAAILAFFFAPKFLELWLGGEYSLRAGWILRFLVLGYFLNSMTAFGNLISLGFGEVKTPTLLLTVLVAAGVLSWGVVIPRYGVLGVSGTFCAVTALYSLSVMAWYNRRVLRVRNLELAAILARPVLLSLPLFAMGVLLRNTALGWWGLGSYGAASYAAYAFLCHRFALTTQERDKLSHVWKPVSQLPWREKTTTGPAGIQA